MIEVKPAGKYDICLSCGTERCVDEIYIRRSPDSNAQIITLCNECVSSLYQKVNGGLS